MKSPKKRVVLIVILIAAVLLAVFPGRRAVREYRFQSALADWAESSGTNAEHISVCLDMMRDLIDRAVDAETVTGQRDCLLALAYWTQDCADSLGTVQTYVRYFETCAGMTDSGKPFCRRKRSFCGSGNFGTVRSPGSYPGRNLPVPSIRCSAIRRLSQIS